MSTLRQRSDRGDSTTQLVIVLPVVLLMTMLAVQIAVFYHSAHVAAAAAAEAAAAGAGLRSGVGDAVPAAEAMIHDLGGEIVAPVQFEVTDQSVSVTVQVRVRRLLPFFPTTVTRTADEPRERFTDEQDR